MSRAFAEGPEGLFLRNQIVTRMWEDSAGRLKKLGPTMGIKQRNEVMEDLLEHFQACILSYDEGLLGDDKVLASAIWRIFFTYECKDFSYLEKLVAYIRAQNDHLYSLDAESLILRGEEFRWGYFPPFHNQK